MSRSVDNRDFLKGANYPRQSYALSGSQLGDSKFVSVRGKNSTNGPPMIITSTPPGAFAFDDEAWKLTFGASQDAFLSLVNGQKISENKVEAEANIQSSTVYKGLPSVITHNLYENADGQQQIQYVVSKDTVIEAFNATKFGALEDVRGIGIRLPMQAAGWGYTIGLRPTDPNPLDKRLNDDEHKLDRATWQNAPIDMRWDSYRKVWRTWNDLIADHSNQNLGTFVFGTCNDNARGFPFQRGKLEDVWSVRTVSQSSPTFGNNDDITKTAEVCTTLAHKLIDPNGNGAAPLWDVFICHQGNPVVCGNETTLIGPTALTPPPDNVEGALASQATLEIRTTAWWHYSNALAGPIHFTSLGLDESQEVAGKMKLVLSQWCPTVNAQEIWGKVSNLCANPIYPFHTSRLTKNSEEVIINGVFDLQRILCEWNEEYTECILEHIAWNACNAGTSIYAWNNLLEPYLLTLTNSISTNVISSVGSAITGLKNSLLAVIASVVAQIQSCFSGLEIVCPVEIPAVADPAVEVPNIEVPNFSLQGCGPPDCLIKSIATYEFEQKEELKITIVNPCLGGTTFTASCADFGQPGGGGIFLIPGQSYGGTDADGDNDIAGKSFGNPATEDPRDECC